MLINDLSLTITPATALYTNTVSDSVITAAESSVEGGNRKAIVLDFNGGDGIYSRDIGTVFSWPASARTILYCWQPSLLELPENAYNRATDWDNGGAPGAKFIQGVVIEADSFNVGKTFQLQSSDDLSLHSLIEIPSGGVAFNKQSVKAFSCVPFVSHNVRVVSTDGIPWQVFDAAIVFQSFPELTRNWTTELTSLGMAGYGHIREMNIAHISTADLTLTLTFDQGSPITLTIANSGGNQRKDKVTLPANKFKLVGFSVTSAAAFRLFEKDIEVKVGQWGRTDAYSVLKPFGGNSNIGAAV